MVTKTPAKSKVDKEGLIWTQWFGGHNLSGWGKHCSRSLTWLVRSCLQWGSRVMGTGSCSPSSLLLYSVPKLSPLPGPGFSSQWRISGNSKSWPEVSLLEYSEFNQLNNEDQSRCPPITIVRSQSMSGIPKNADKRTPVVLHRKRNQSKL